MALWSPFNWYNIKDWSVLYMNYSTRSNGFNKTPHSNFSRNETSWDVWCTGNYVCLKCIMLSQQINFFFWVIIPPANEVAGVYSDPYVRPFVRPFVRSSVRPSQSLIRYSSKTAEQNFMKL